MHAPTVRSAIFAIAVAAAGCAHTADDTRHRIRAEERALARHRPRLAAAMTALERVVGHPVELDVDGAALSGTDVGLDVARELESLTKTINNRAQVGDLVATRVLDEFHALEVRYEPVHPSRVFDARGRRLVIRVPAGDRWHAAKPLLAESERRLTARFEGRAPASIAQQEVPLYAFWLMGEERSEVPARIARSIGPLVTIEAQLEPERRKEARHAILRGASRARNEIDAATRASFADWARANLHSMSADEVDALSRVIANEPDLRGLDPIAFIFAAADVWVAAGRPIFAFAESDVSLARFPPLVGRVLTPGPPFMNPGPYARIATSQERIEALLQGIDARRDPLLRKVVAVHLFETTCDVGDRKGCARVEQTLCNTRMPTASPGDDLAIRLGHRCERRR